MCHAIVLISSGARVGWSFDESLYQETLCHDYTTINICLPSSFFTNEISEEENPKNKKTDRPPVKLLALLVKTEFFSVRLHA